MPAVQAKPSNSAKPVKQAKPSNSVKPAKPTNQKHQSTKCVRIAFKKQKQHKQQVFDVRSQLRKAHKQ